MVEGSVAFHDVLGREIATIRIEEDAALEANGTFTQSGRYMPGDLDRLATVNPDHVVAETCIRAVLFSDGVVERFDE